MSADLLLNEVPQLSKGLLMIGLSGWGNAGNVSTLCVDYLIEKLGATEIGEIVPGRFYNYQAQRPLVRIEKGVIQEYLPPRNQFYCWKSRSGHHDILLLRGVEPHIDWPAYAQAVLDVATRAHVQQVYMIGSYVGNVPHTAEPVLSISTRSASLLREQNHLGFELSDYNGPTGVYSEILEKTHESGIDAISLWGAVPPYIQGSNPKVAFHVLDKIISMTGLEVSLQEIRKKGEDLDRKIADEARQNPELRRLIASLELEYRSMQRFSSYTV